MWLVAAIFHTHGPSQKTVQKLHSAVHIHMNRTNSCLLVIFSFSVVILCVTVYLS